MFDQTLTGKDQHAGFDPLCLTHPADFYQPVAAIDLLVLEISEDLHPHSKQVVLLEHIYFLYATSMKFFYS